MLDNETISRSNKMLVRFQIIRKLARVWIHNDWLSFDNLITGILENKIYKVEFSQEELSFINKNFATNNLKIRFEKCIFNEVLTCY